MELPSKETVKQLKALEKRLTAEIQVELQDLSNEIGQEIQIWFGGNGAGLVESYKCSNETRESIEYYCKTINYFKLSFLNVLKFVPQKYKI